MIGLAHAHLVWYGDILVLYGVCGMVLYWLRRCWPWFLLAAGLALIGIGSGISLLSGLSMPFWPEAQIVEFQNDWQPSGQAIASELAIYRGGWIKQMEHRVPMALQFETLILLVWGFWRAGGMMLVGMALFKWGVFKAEKSRRFYLSLVIQAVAVGIPVILYGVHQNSSHQWDVRYSFFFGAQYNGWGSIAVCLGYVALVMLLCQSGFLAGLQRRLAAIGQTALSNYLLQSLICTTIFYGHGFGLFGKVSRIGQLGIVVAVWLLQLIVSPLWLRRFRFGPVEWLWRSATYLRIQPLRRSRD